MNWISVRDRLPEDQVEVLVATRSKNGVRNIDKGYLAIDHFIHRGRAEVTHWMPLPEPPKEEKEWKMYMKWYTSKAGVSRRF